MHYKSEFLKIPEQFSLLIDNVSYLKHSQTSIKLFHLFKKYVKYSAVLTSVILIDLCSFFTQY